MFVIKPAGERHTVLVHPDMLEALRAHYNLTNIGSQNGLSQNQTASGRSSR
jgi:hypothetical protein